MKSYIWSLPTRVFHWSFALLITICLLTGDDFLTIHAIAGYLLLVPFLFRIGWGVFGPRYSKFKDFPLSIKKAKEFSRNIFNTEQKYIGHNPPASFVMISMLIIVPFIILTGAISFSQEEAKGLFITLSKNEIYEDLHELISNLMYLLIFLHLAGIIVDRLLHKKHATLESIFKGYKNTKENFSVKVNWFQKIYFTIFVIVFFLFAFYLIFDSNNIFLN